MTKEEVLERLRALAIRLGTPRLRLKDLKAAGLQYQVSRHFTGMAVALKEAGLEPTPLAEKMNTSNEELLSYLLGLEKKVGKRPTVMDVRRDAKYSEVIFAKRFGNIRKAYELASGGPQDSSTKEAAEIFLEDFPNKALFWGKAAELYIVAELMFRGFNSSLIPVDLGVDVVAIKDDRTYYFQVKNVSFDKTTSRTISITTSSFSKNRGSNVFYTFVLQRGLKRDTLILPYQRIHEIMKKGLIIFNDESKDFSICFSINREVVNVHLPSDKSKSEDLSSYLNDWDVIV